MCHWVCLSVSISMYVVGLVSDVFVCVCSLIS